MVGIPCPRILFYPRGISKNFCSMIFFGLFVRRLFFFALLGGAASSLFAQASFETSKSTLLSKQTLSRLLLIDASRAGNRLVAAGERGSIIYSDDNGHSWQRAKVPTAPLLTAIFFIDAQNGWAVGHDMVILRTTNAGETWVQQFSAPLEQRPFLDVLFLDTSRGIAVGAYGAYYETSNGGKTWTARKIADDDKHYNGIIQLAAGKLLIVGEAGTLLKSDDSGQTWSALMPPYKGSYFGAIAAKNAHIIIYGLRGKIFRSSDGGNSWTAVDNSSVASIMGSTQLADGTLVLAGLSGTVLVSRDDGQSFVALPTDTIKAFSTALPSTSNVLLLFGETGVRDIPMKSAAKTMQAIP